MLLGVAPIEKNKKTKRGSAVATARRKGGGRGGGRVGRLEDSPVYCFLVGGERVVRTMVVYVRGVCVLCVFVRVCVRARPSEQKKRGRARAKKFAPRAPPSRVPPFRPPAAFPPPGRHPLLRLSGGVLARSAEVKRGCGKRGHRRASGQSGGAWMGGRDERACSLCLRAAPAAPARSARAPPARPLQPPPAAAAARRPPRESEALQLP